MFLRGNRGDLNQGQRSNSVKVQRRGGTYLFGELETAIVLPGARLAGVIAVDRGGRNEREGSGGRGFPGRVLGFPGDDEPFGRRKMLKAILRRRNTEKMEASGSF